MNYLTLENISKTYGDKVLFKDISFQINKGQKIALVAKNGAGKSTLLRVLAGIENGEGETARIGWRKDIRIGYLVQEPEFNPNHTVLEAIFETNNRIIQAIKAYEYALLQPENTQQLQSAVVLMDDLKAWDFEAKIKEILDKFQINELEQKVALLSGGQKKRLSIAKLIIDDPELLILDEPTNHLDLDMIEWLEEYLQQKQLTIFMVTHDRYFLERVCNQIIELDRGELYRYSGSYGDFLEKKAIRHENEKITLDKDRKLLKKELEWVRRMPKARGTKAKSRVDAFDVLDNKVASAKVERNLQIDIKGRRLGKTILEMLYVNKSFGDLNILKNFTHKFAKNEKVGLVGPNGVGKTTFLKIITQELPPDNGKIVQGVNTVFGYYTQSGMDLKEDKRVIDVITDVAEYIPLENGQKITAPRLMERFLFSRKQQQVYVSQLSGGEKRRLYLLSILMKNPNFLILDEPTNDLDIMTLNILEDFLLDFPGCVVIVTHDRYFMDKIVDHLFIFEGDGRIKDFNGDYSSYRFDQNAKDTDQIKEEKEKAVKENPKPVNKDNGLNYEQRKELSRTEKEINKLEIKKAEIEASFNNPDLTPDKIKELSIQLKHLEDQIEEKEMRWMELAELA